MLYAEHSAILTTFIQLQFVIKIFVLSILSGRFTKALLYIRIIDNRYERIVLCPSYKFNLIRFYKIFLAFIFYVVFFFFAEICFLLHSLKQLVYN